MNHKRKRPKHQRAGCLLCKYHKDERRPRRTRRGEQPLRPNPSQFSEAVECSDPESEFWCPDYCESCRAQEAVQAQDAPEIPPLTLGEVLRCSIDAAVLWSADYYYVDRELPRLPWEVLTRS